MDSDELGHFSLLEKIGEGGMGRVYKARDKSLARLVAIKLLSEARRADADRRARFVQEAKAASALNHPNIITIHEIGEQDGQTFIVMELVDGKPLNELIPRKGMRLTEALRIAAQVADALTTAHAAGIVHRDLKPANIMVDAHGRVKVLDFGLAKLFATAASVTAAADESTRTVAMDQPVTEEGVILGSIPYMSPEQAEGRPVDARSDIFSFGAVLYEMITGQRAFRGESRASTLAAVVEKDPQPPSESSSTTPPELDRLVARCLRKDINRRSQNMADVKLALEELRDESESGKLPRPAAVPVTAARRWVWQAAVIASVLIAAAALTWTYLDLVGTRSKPPALVRVSPDDGHSYSQPAISPDGGFVAYVSDRSGTDQLWLQQVGGGDPIQLTHSNDAVAFPNFFPDGKRILYVTTSESQKSTVYVVSTLGGDPQLLIQGGGQILNYNPIVSPDGRQIAYLKVNNGVHLMTASSSGGPPRELTAWSRTPHDFYGSIAWTSDSRYLFCLMSNTTRSAGSDEHEWDAFPIDGGDPIPMGASAMMRPLGFALGRPVLMVGDRVLFLSDAAGAMSTWEVRLVPGPWRVQGAPRRLTFGTEVPIPASVSTAGTVALDVGRSATDIYLIPLSPTTGQPTGVARRLTKDGRQKDVQSFVGGDADTAYFGVADFPSDSWNYFALDLDSGKQTFVAATTIASGEVVISADRRHIAYSVPEGDAYSIRSGDTGVAGARVLCKACGAALGFSPDGRFLLYRPESRPKGDPNRKYTARLLDIVTGKDRPWLEYATDSVFASPLGGNSEWIWVVLHAPGSPSAPRGFMVRWREEPPPQAEWIASPLPREPGGVHYVVPFQNFLYIFEGSKLMMSRFDVPRAAFSEPREVNFLPGSAVNLKASNYWTVCRQGLVFSRGEPGNGSVWLMKLPH